jgi:hypothetical protein
VNVAYQQLGTKNFIDRNSFRPDIDCRLETATPARAGKSCAAPFAFCLKQMFANRQAIITRPGQSASCGEIIPNIAKAAAMILAERLAPHAADFA